MKKGVLCVAALLVLGTGGAMADELTAPPALVINAESPYLNWSGFYAGLEGGYTWGRSSLQFWGNDPAAQLGTCGKCIPNTSFWRDGPLIGGELGYNWQISTRWLVGAETDYQWADLNGTGVSAFTLAKAGASNMIANEKVEAFGTTRVRLGAVITPPLLLYGTAGLAYGQVSESVRAVAGATGSFSSGGFSYACVAGTTCFSGSSAKTLWGWAAGAGGEYALTTNWTVKTEVLYVSLQAPSATAVAQGVVAGTVPASITAKFSSVSFIVLRGGVNFRF